MAGRDECPKRLVEHLGLAHGTSRAVIARVPYDRVGERMVSEVLLVLVGVAALGRRRMQQRKAQRVVRGFVPAVLAVVEHRDPVAAVRVGEVGPLLRIDLVGGRGVVAPRHGAHAKVIDRLGVRDRKRELGLQQRIGRLPVDVVHKVDPVGLGAFAQRDPLPEAGIPQRAFHAYRGAQGPLFGHGDLHLARDGLRRCVHGLLEDLPGRPAVRLVLREERKADGLAGGHQLAAMTLVDDRRDVAVGVQRKFIDAVLQPPCAGLYRRGLRLPALADVVDGIPRSRDGGLDQQPRLPLLRAQHLRGNPDALVVVDRELAAFERKRNLHHVRDLEPRSVVEHHGEPFDIGIQTPRNRANRGREYVPELFERDQLVVPRELVGTGEARTRKVVVKLVPDKAFPGLGENLARVGHGPEPVGGNGAALGSVRKLLVTAVVELHRGLRGIATRGMHIHQQLPVPHRKLRVGGIGKIVLVEAVARGADNLHRPVALQSQFQSPNRLDGRGAARVPRTIVMVNGIQRVALGDVLQVLAVAEVFVTPLGRIVVRVHHGHDTGAVNALPQADLERNLARTVERAVPPHEFLSRETDKTAVGRDRRKRPPETEAVRKEDVRAFDPEFPAVEVLPVQNIAREGLRRRDVRIRRVPRAARDMPAPLADVTLDQLVLVGVVLLHPLVLDAPFEIEYIIRVGAQEEQVLIQRLWNVLTDRTLHIPVPLGIKMGVRD